VRGRGGTLSETLAVHAAVDAQVFVDSSGFQRASRGKSVQDATGLIGGDFECRRRFEDGHRLAFGEFPQNGPLRVGEARWQGHGGREVQRADALFVDDHRDARLLAHFFENRRAQAETPHGDEDAVVRGGAQMSLEALAVVSVVHRLAAPQDVVVVAVHAHDALLAEVLEGLADGFDAAPGDVLDLARSHAAGRCRQKDGLAGDGDVVCGHD
jgi:hypothetical protein